MSLVSSNDKPGAALAKHRIGIRFVPTSPVSIPIRQATRNRMGSPGSAQIMGKAKRMTFLALSARLARRGASMAAEWTESPQKTTVSAEGVRPPLRQAKGRL